MSTSTRVTLSLILIAILVSFAGYVGLYRPDLIARIDERLAAIRAGRSPLGTLSPARDLRGTWGSSLPGKGMEFFGQGNGPQGGTVRVYQQADLVWRIVTVEDGVAAGDARMFNEMLWGEVTGVPLVGTIPIPRQTSPDTGFQPMTIRVSGSALEFPSLTIGGIEVKMNGTFTSDGIVAWGGGTGNVAGATVTVKTEMHLTRCSSMWHGTGCP